LPLRREAPGRAARQSLWQILSEDQRHRTIAHLETLTPDKPTGENEISWVAPDGTVRWVSFVNHALFDSQGRVVEYQSVGRDVTDRHERELQLERAVAEKEILLKEIHHRVKNNMAVISSLLSLHEREIEDPATREVFKAMRSRIKTMSLVHEQLYRSETSSTSTSAATSIRWRARSSSRRMTPRAGSSCTGTSRA